MILCGDALEQLQTVAAGSCRTCVTSPPYYGLRDYGAARQIGLEESPDAYVSRLVEVFREVRQVLADDGTLWMNMADTYSSGDRKTRGSDPKYAHRSTAPRPNPTPGIKPKDLMGIPWMLAFALRADGWYLRQEIIWHKPNAMPESVTDRCTKSHESLFLLAKSRNYYFDHMAIQEPRVGCNDDLVAGSIGAFGNPQSRPRRSGDIERKERPAPEARLCGNVPYDGQSGKRNRRDVWSVATAKNKIDHFATFPAELVRPCILAGSAEGDTVLDPFLGSGTTAVVATQEGREFVGVELNPEYVGMAALRVQNEGHKQMEMEGYGA